MNTQQKRSRPVRTTVEQCALGSLVAVDGELVRVTASTENSECVAFEAQS